MRSPGVDENHRPDIDGMRAIAVLAVILFHVDERLLPGGFVGVDVFFVISGFLITGNILREMGVGRFSLAEFYRRRIKRISLPMLVVVGVVVAAAQSLMLPPDAVLAARSGLWSTFSLANVYFWKYLDRSYFAADSRQAPLLHLWSLGVEEQFYLLWPLLLAFGLRRPATTGASRRASPDPGLAPSRARVVTVGLLAASSFLLAEALARTKGPFAFYMLPTRAWELLLGALAAIAVVSRRIGEAPRWLAGLGVLLGLAMIATAIAVLDGKDPFPGRLALAPVLGTVLVLLSGHSSANPVSRLLSARPLVAIGLVSYSAYLWHWPLLALHRYGYGEVGRVAGVVVVALTFLLAWASWRWIETPARRSAAAPRAVFLRQFAIPAAVVCMLVASAVFSGGFGPRLLSRSYLREYANLDARSRAAEDTSRACNVKRITTREMSAPRCVFGPKDAPLGMLLWGDSQAMHYLGMMEAFASSGGFRFRQVDAWACPPMEGDPGAVARRTEDCRASSEAVLGDVSKYPVVALAALWPGYGGEPFMERTIALARKLAEAGHEVVLVGRTPRRPGLDLRCDQKALSFPLEAVCARGGHPSSAMDRGRECTPTPIRFGDARHRVFRRERRPLPRRRTVSNTRCRGPPTSLRSGPPFLGRVAMARRGRAASERSAAAVSRDRGAGEVLAGGAPPG